MQKILVFSIVAVGLLAGCGGGASTKVPSSPAGITGKTASASASATTPPGGSTVGHSLTGPSATTRSTPAPPSRASAAASAQLKQALGTFAACLSRNGVNVPSASGSRTAPALSLKGVDTKSPAYRRALAVCSPVVDAALKAATAGRPGSASSSGGGSASGGSPGTGASPGAPRSARVPAVKIPASVTAGFERFTACMRSNGIAGFPEPQGASFNLSGTNLNPHSPQYKAAEAHCNPILLAVDSGG